MMAPLVLTWSFEMHQELRIVPEAERVFLTIGAALMVGCFLAGQSVSYRAIHLLFVLPALLTLATKTGKHLPRVAVALVIGVMWGDALHVRRGRLDGLLWLAVQAAWWIAMTILAALLLSLLRDSLAWRSLLRHNPDAGVTRDGDAPSQRSAGR
jgi:hypothetical protein